ncbi:MAG: proline--tRNA ligase [Actinobacteria bacterium]|nr:MAG: proline--tRNA ligase [Actinomycetota bacterium]REK40394.1 MAG: proline--tRNA ligase [Actinomycetota bacterium]
MRWSQTFIPTLRDDPADAEAISHKLLVRGGFIRQLAAGSYTMLTLGNRTWLKIANIIREEMNAIGGQEMILPTLHPAEIWKQSGRYDLMGDNLFKLKDRKGMDQVLGMTEEEIFGMLASELSSYRQLPQIWYQMHTKFRDEPRPKSGLLRVREFTMKDSYTLDIDRTGLDTGFEKHRAAYRRIFARMGMKAIDVEASSGAMGGSESVEFIVRSDAGEDWIVTCENCDYRANREKATSALGVVEDGEPGELDRFPTPGLRTIKALAEKHPEIASPERQIKSLVYYLEGEPVVVLLRGDHDLEEQKMLDAMGVGEDIRAAQPEEIEGLLGAQPGSLGAVGVKDLRVVADEALRGRVNMTTGANEDDWHYSGVSVERDIDVSVWADLRTVKAGDRCINCDGSLDLWKGIEVGHIFKLGTKYSEAFGAYVQDEEGNSHPVIMGSYGIGVERAMAAVVESSHDDNGMVWPVPVAPFEVVLTVLRADDETTMTAAMSLYEALAGEGLDVILDDRSERPGVKFADAELVGIPYRITVGPRGVESGVIELTTRDGLETVEVPLGTVVERTTHIVKAAREA